MAVVGGRPSHAAARSVDRLASRTAGEVGGESGDVDQIDVVVAVGIERRQTLRQGWRWGGRIRCEVRAREADGGKRPIGEIGVAVAVGVAEAGHRRIAQPGGEFGACVVPDHIATAGALGADAATAGIDLATRRAVVRAAVALAGAGIRITKFGASGGREAGACFIPNDGATIRVAIADGDTA